MTGSIDEQVRQWEEEGYLLLENAVQGEQLARLQRTFDHWAAACKDDWLDAVARGERIATFYDIPDPLEKDDIFIDLVDHPSWYELLLRATCGALVFIAPQVRTVPPWPLSYTGWHPDVSPTAPLHIKVQIYVEDVAPGTGEFAFVPGSHKPASGPYASPHRNESMPGNKTFPGPAGTAIMFNSYGWHTAMDNAGHVRKSIILIYEQRDPGNMRGDNFSAIADKCTTPERRALFRLEV